MSQSLQNLKTLRAELALYEELVTLKRKEIEMHPGLIEEAKLARNQTLAELVEKARDPAALPPPGFSDPGKNRRSCVGRHEKPSHPIPERRGRGMAGRGSGARPGRVRT